MKADWTREELIAICERAVVSQQKWMNRDSAESHAKIGKAWAYLRAGCAFTVLTEGSLKTDDRTIWVEIVARGFDYFEGGCFDEDNFYLPTPERLDAVNGGDWY